MKAFVMAAGAGTRLRPLTLQIPKPMVPIANKPVIEHTIENLAKHGFTDAVLNLHLFPETIKNYLGNGKKYGINLHYSLEKKLMGTAGGLKKVEQYFNDTFVVMSGDGLTDINLIKAISFHKAKKALATIVLKDVDSRFDYGIIFTNKNGRISKFVEKPSWSEVFASTVNTGIYIIEPKVFEYIPKNKVFDFAKDLWPLLLKKKLPIFGYETNEYWADVGNMKEYRKAANDALEQNICINMPVPQVKKHIWIGKNTKIDKTAKIIAPCIIGNFCTIEKNATVGPCTTIGNNSKVSMGSKVSNSILWDNTFICKNVILNSCVVGSKAKVSDGILIYEGTILNH